MGKHNGRKRNMRTKAGECKRGEWVKWGGEKNCEEREMVHGKTEQVKGGRTGQKH